VSHWSQLLTIPVPGYLEGPAGPAPFRHVECVQIATARVRGGIAGRRLEFVDIQDDVLANIRATRVMWELHQETWLIDGVFDARPVSVVHIANPYRGAPLPANMALNLTGVPPS
jgi:hypothetical protein